MSKYKFSLSAPVKSYVEWQLEHYHEDKRQLEQYRLDLMPTATANYNFNGGGRASEPGNPTERAALKMATNPYILATERSIRAIDAVLERCDETEKKLVELVYWRKSHTVFGAAMKVNYSTKTAYRHINSILCSIALELGLVSF